ncbi:YjbF family lipoprotein [Mangrovicoccus sp. HB161399]|uniref:YjbF family lipoprotein n=1 Tax=Mangrovicoccus sp. HB161399 TaxID=2720392 RepID=UPI0015547C6B|nr:YjbF family lipoprotein [Mangrovicoccus sp. HB161399]
MKTRKLGLAAVLAASLLAACGNAPVDTSINSIISGSLQTIGAAIFPPPPREGPVVTRAQVEAAAVPLIMVDMEVTGDQATAIVFGNNGNAVTWITLNGVTFTLKNGALFSTRGLGPDLLTATTKGLADALPRRATARYARDLRFIAGDESILKDRFFCELVNEGPEDRVVLQVRHSATRMRESCYAMESGRDFTNIYWVGADGIVWDSRQWISEMAGYVEIRRLYR